MAKWLRSVTLGGACLLMVVTAPGVLAQSMSVPPGGQVGPLTAGAGNGPYTPPPCVAGVPFADVTCSTFYDGWIEQFARDGITAGCGGGNYCPNENVTRAQMAVFIEAAMRGTGNWPAHTQLVWAVKAADGSPDPVASGTALLDAVAAIPTSGNDVPSSTNPWLLKLGPGIFNLGTATLSLPQWVNLEGSGVNGTTVAATTNSGSVIYCSGRNEVRALTVENTGTGSQASGMWLAGHVDLTGVKITVIGASSINSGVVSNNGNVSTFTDVWAEGDGGTDARGLENQSGTVIVHGGNIAAFAGNTLTTDAIILFGGTVQVFDAIVSGPTTVYNFNNSGAASVAGSQLEGGSVSGTVTCAGVYDGSFGFHASTCP